MVWTSAGVLVCLFEHDTFQVWIDTFVTPTRHDCIFGAMGRRFIFLLLHENIIGLVHGDTTTLCGVMIFGMWRCTSDAVVRAKCGIVTTVTDIFIKLGKEKALE
jgi:hypothetical protein